MDLLKKGIVIGMGAHDMSKKQVEDFVNKLHESKFVTKDHAKELIKTILRRKGQVNDNINSKIENFLKMALQKEQLATMSHIEYLEKRIDLLEEELYNLLLEKYITDVDDDEIMNLLRELEMDSSLEKKEKGKKGKYSEKPLFDEDWLKSDDALYNHIVNVVDDSKEKLEDLLCLSKEGEANMVKKKKIKKKKKAAKPAKKKKR